MPRLPSTPPLAGSQGKTALVRWFSSVIRSAARA